MQTLKEQGIELFTKARSNMKRMVYSPFDQALSRKRLFIETVFDELKNLYQIERTRPSLSR